MGLDYHLERALRINVTSEYKSLYSWSIGEVDEHGEQVGRDQIPWRWTQYFTATEIVLRDELEVKAKIEDESPLVRQDEEVSQRRTIHATLRPGDQRSDRDYFRSTTFRMFGSDREIKDFTLDIYPLGTEDEPEKCTAWGIVSYDTNDDFHPDTTDDIVGFYLMVKPSTFQHCVDRISNGTADEVLLAVGGVDGFYSKWSPDIFTRDVKVLTGYVEQKVEMPAGATGEVPRLHFVGEAKLYINATRKQAKRATPEDDEDEPNSAPLVRPEVADAGGGIPAPDSQLGRLLGQVRTLARWIIGLLVVLIVVTLWRR